MPNEEFDFWPADLDGADPDAPVLLLRTQASLLGKKFKNILEASVDTNRVGAGIFRHDFDIRIPSMGYTYTLFWIQHGLDPYPVTWTFDTQQGRLASKEEYTAWLRATLSSDRTKRIVRTLLAQAGAEPQSAQF
jgi:hypothetical protein